MSKTICVTGATGKQGGCVVDSLLKRGDVKVRCLVRDPSSNKAQALKSKGVELVKGDFDNMSSMVAAFTGADAVFLVIPLPELTEKGAAIETKWGLAAVEAIKTASTPYVVYSSCGSCHRNSGVPHFDSKAIVEKALQATSIPCFLLRPVCFFDNLDSKEIQTEWTEGTLPFLTASDCRVNMVSCEDIGEVAAITLTDPEKYKGRTIELSGEKISGNEMAAVVSKLRGAPWKYSPAPLFLLGIFVPELATMVKYFHSTGFIDEVEESRKIYPGMQTFEMYAKKNGLDKKEFKKPAQTPIWLSVALTATAVVGIAILTRRYIK